MSNNQDFTEQEFRTLFTPQSGWGGRLKKWIQNQSYFVKGGFLLLTTLVVITYSFRLSTQPTESPEGLRASPSIQPADHITIARNIAHNSFLAARLVMAGQPSIEALSRGQRLFIETNLAHTATSLSADFIFLRRDIERLSRDALNLTPSQSKKWHELATSLKYR